jgi:uncharacterized membrane protein YpjA
MRISKQEIWRFLWDKRFLSVLLLINILGSFYGYYWYRGQLAATNVLLWPFVPDSPLSTTLFSLVLVLYLLGKKSSLLSLLAGSGSMDGPAEKL